MNYQQCFAWELDTMDLFCFLYTVFAWATSVPIAAHLLFRLKIAFSSLLGKTVEDLGLCSCGSFNSEFIRFCFRSLVLNSFDSVRFDGFWHAMIYFNIVKWICILHAIGFDFISGFDPLLKSEGFVLAQVVVPDGDVVQVPVSARTFAVSYEKSINGTVPWSVTVTAIFERESIRQFRVTSKVLDWPRSNGSPCSINLND